MLSASGISAPAAVVHHLKDKEAQPWGRFIYALGERKSMKKVGEEAWSSDSWYSSSSRGNACHSTGAENVALGERAGRKDGIKTTDTHTDDGTSDQFPPCRWSASPSPSRSVSLRCSSRSSTVGGWSQSREPQIHGMDGAPPCTSPWACPLGERVAAPPTPADALLWTSAVRPLASSLSPCAAPTTACLPCSMAAPHPPPLPPPDDAADSLLACLYHLSFSPWHTLHAYDALVHHYFHDRCHRCHPIKERLQQDVEDMCMAVVQATLASFTERDASGSSGMPLVATPPSEARRSASASRHAARAPRSDLCEKGKSPSRPRQTHAKQRVCFATPEAVPPPTRSQRMSDTKPKNESKKKTKTKKKHSSASPLVNRTATTRRANFHDPIATDEDGRLARAKAPAAPLSSAEPPHILRRPSASPEPSLLGTPCWPPSSFATLPPSVQQFWAEMHQRWRQRVRQHASLCDACNDMFWMEVAQLLRSHVDGVTSLPQRRRVPTPSPLPPPGAMEVEGMTMATEPSMLFSAPLRRSTTAPRTDVAVPVVGKREEEDEVAHGRTGPLRDPELTADPLLAVPRAPTTPPNHFQHDIHTGSYTKKKKKEVREGQTKNGLPLGFLTPPQKSVSHPSSLSCGRRDTPADTRISLTPHPSRTMGAGRQKEAETRHADGSDTITPLRSKDVMSVPLVDGSSLPFLPSFFHTPSSVQERTPVMAPRHRIDKEEDGAVPERHPMSRPVPDLGDTALAYLLQTFSLDRVRVESAATVSPHQWECPPSATGSVRSRSRERSMVSRVCVPPRDEHHDAHVGWRQHTPSPHAFETTPLQPLPDTDAHDVEWEKEADRRLTLLAMRWEHTEDWMNRQHPVPPSEEKREKTSPTAHPTVATSHTIVTTGVGSGKEASVLSEDMEQLQKVLEPRMMGSYAYRGGADFVHPTERSVGRFYGYGP